MKKKFKELSESDISYLIEMAWEDEVPFESIRAEYGLTNNQVIKLMRKNLEPDSFKMWRKRTQGRNSKHKKISRKKRYDIEY
jgi:uncharacterized protein (TIGR03643 family)